MALFAPRRGDPDLAKLPLRPLCSPKRDLKKPSKISQIALRRASRHALFHSRLVRRFGRRSGFISNDWCLEKLASAPGGANTPAPRNPLFLIQFNILVQFLERAMTARSAQPRISHPTPLCRATSAKSRSDYLSRQSSLPVVQLSAQCPARADISAIAARADGVGT